ncbi:VCBS repeat-containing protein [Streptomyces sp. Je 1-79]|uniref:FG-GAP repeat domain-containing protein n=1 Tax=Streptomyces sp. Je 1-79 TaxID=2943847 RepID=UPI0021A837E1|nr:VCBS repeat-containing protein [Streptomyces sp. Je 1-79]MCT4353225.1 VCBS repeat-containing protein [Streptomyces sp. Je 1-79]
MIHARPARRRLVVSVVTVLAVTAGGGALAAPAVAAPAVEATHTAAAAEVAPFPAKSTVFGATATGFLTSTEVPPMDEAGPTYSAHWVPADGSAVKDIGWGFESTGSGDIVASHGATKASLTDVATGAKLRSVTFETGHTYAGAAGKALFTTVLNVNGDRLIHMHTTTSGSGKMTAGLPGNATGVTVKAGTATHALVTYSTGTDADAEKHIGLLDLAANAITETYEVPPVATTGKSNFAVSATHFAWVEYDANENVTVVAVDRATKNQQRFEVGAAWRKDVELGLVGDWVTYGTRSGLTDDVEPEPLAALTARSLKDGTTTRKLLDHTLTAAVAPDGAQTVRGGTVEQGEGVYRIAPGADGTPAATLVASSGESTKVALLGSKVPAVVDLDAHGGRIPLEFTLSRYNVRAQVTLRHVQTGKVYVVGSVQPENGVVRFDWTADLDNDRYGAESALPGAYTWEISAEPMNGIGQTLKETGAFTATRKAAPHDYDDNGSPDVLVRDSAGKLWRTDSHYDVTNGQLRPAEQELVGSGWNMFNQIEAAGDIAGGPAGDLVARDTSGVLWHYLGKGDGTFASRVKIGPGWQIYNKIAAGSDLNGDGRPDLLATDTAGALYLYKGTGSATAPYSARVKVGTGWGIFNQLTAVGDIAGSAAGDLVARDSSGVLWLYQGRGDGTFAPRTRVGSGWNAYTHLVGVGDANRDGRPDLYAYGPNGTYLYKGTGSATAPFGSKEATSVPDTAPLTHTSVI